MSSSSTSSSSPQALLLLDRFSSARTASDDMHQALQGLYKELRAGTLLATTLVSDDAVWKRLLQLLQEQQENDSNDSDQEDNDVHQACTRVVLEMNRYLLQQDDNNKESSSKALLEQPGKGQWLEAWVDLACSSSNTTSSYTRVLALQCLQLLLQREPQRAQEQLLSAPNALHRLGGGLLLGGGGQADDGVVDDVVRNEALLLAATLTKTSAAASKIWIFEELPQHLLGLCVSSSLGGLTSGNVLVLDCLHILHNMLAHDATAAQLVWQSSQSQSFAQGLAQLLDLRQGIEFLKPGTTTSSSSRRQEVAAAAAAPIKSSASSSKDADADDNDDDDLDDLIASGSSSTSKNKAGASSGGGTTQEAAAAAAQAQQIQQQIYIIPHLTAPEEDIIRCVLDLIQMLLQQQETLHSNNKSGDDKKNAWRDAFFQKEHVLVSVIWDLALVAPPLPGTPAPCAMPSNALQRHALHVTASVLNDPTTCTRLSGMDRLLYLSCTGRGGGSSSSSSLPTSNLEDRWSMSLAAVHVLRETFHSTAQDYLLHALAPPPDIMQEGDREAQELAQRAAQVVPRLLLTVQGYLQQVVVADLNGKEQQLPQDDVLVGLMGSLLALGVFVQENEASRSMLLKLTDTLQQQQQQAQQSADESSVAPPPSLLDDLFHALSSLSILQPDQDLLQSESEPQEQVCVCILRFLGEWMQGASMVVQALLSHATSSTILPALLLSSNSASASRQGLAALILGLSMAYLEDERKCGGWTRETLLDLLLVRNKTTASGSRSTNASGLSSLTTQLIAVVKDKKKSMDGLLPWWRDEMEATVWSEWYQDAVWTVRKCVVRELTISSSSSFGSDDKQESSDDKENTGTSGDASSSPKEEEKDAEPVDMARYRALQTLVSQQSKDLDQVRQALSKTEKQVSSQEKQLSMWQKRVESTPTELDRLLTDSTTRNTELEQTVVDLKEELATIAAKDQEEIKSRDETIASLQKELQESKAREDECREERDSLREDMAGLSAAYSNLEEEYRRCQQEMAATATAVDTTTTTTTRSASTPPGEGGREEVDVDRTVQPVVHEQPQGEASEQIPSGTAASSTVAVAAATATATAGSTEVATLRAENSRLRNDARAAEEWMAMAVERLGDMNTRNTMLEQQVQSMEAEMEALRSSETQHSEGQDQRLAEERELRVHAEQEMAELSAALHASLQEERGRRAEIEGTAAQAQEAAERSLVEEQDRRAHAEAALAQAHDQMQTIHDQLSKERDDARAQLSRLEEQLARQTPAESEEQSAQAQAQVLTLQDTIDSLNEQLAAAQAQANDQMQTKQEEIYRHESRIRELESKLGDGLGTYTMEDIHSRDEELQQLRESNEAAQAWMSKAVEHHNMLSEQLADLSNENSSLKSKVQDLMAKESATSAASNLIEDLQRDLKNRDEELASVNAQLLTKERQLQELVVAHAEETKTITHQLSQSTAEVEMLRAGLKAEEAKIQQLADQSEGSSMVEEELRATTDELMKTVKMKEFELEEAKAQVAAMDMEVAELKADLALETEEKDDALAQVERVRKELQVETENVQKEGESSASDRQQIEALESALAEARDRLKGDENVLHQWEDRVAELEATIKDLENQLESQTQDASDAIAQWQDRCSKLEGSAVETSESDHEQADRIAELEALLKYRDEQLEEAEREGGNVVAQWEQSYLDLEKQLEQAQEELNVAKKSKEDALLAKEGETLTQITHTENELQAQSLNEAALSTQHQTEIDRLTAAVSELRVELDESNEKRLKLEEQRDAALSTLETSEREADDVVNEWEQSYNDIRQQLTQLEEEQVAREQEKVAEITELQSQLTERNTRLLELGQTLGERESAVDDTIAKVASYESEVEALSQQTAALTKERDTLQEQLAQVERDSHQIVQQWKERSDTIEQQLAQLQSELQSSNDEKEDAVARDQASSALVTEFKGRISELESNAAQLSDKCEQYEATVADLGRKNDDLTLQADDYTDKISALELAMEEGRAAADENSKNADAYRQQLSGLHEQLTRAQNELRLAAEAREDATVHEHEKSMQVSDLEEKLRLQQEKASEELAAEQEKHDGALAVRDQTISELQSQFQDHTDKLSSLELEVEEARTALVGSLENCASQKDEIEQLQQQIGSLTTEKEALEATIEEEQRESEDVVSQWEESYNTLHEQLTQAQNELRLALEAREDASVHEQEKSMQVSDLEEKLRLQQEKASEELSAAQEKHDAELAARDQTIGELQSQWTDVSDKLSSLERELEDGRTELDKGIAKVASQEHEVESFQEQIAQLSSEKETLEAQLEEEQRDAEEVILQWEESYNALSLTLEQVQEDLRLACEDKDEATARESQTKSQIDDLTEQLVRARNELQISSEETGFTSTREQEFAKQVENLETQLDEAKHEVAVLEKEKNDCLDREEEQLAQITELQERAHEVQTASDQLLADLQQREASITERDHTIGEQQSQLVELGSEISELRQTSEQHQSDHAAIVGGLEERAAVSELEVKNLSQKIEMLVQDRDALQEKLEQATESVESSVSHWETRHNDVSQQLKLAREEHSVATAEKEEAVMRVEQLQMQIDELKESFSVQESKAAEALSAERRDHEEAIASLNFTLDELRSNVTEQAEKYSATEHASKEQQEQELSVVDELRKTVDTQALEIESLEQRIQGLIDERNDLAEQVGAQTSIAAEEKQEHSRGESSLQEQIGTLRRENLEMDDKISLLEENLQAESQRRSSVEDELRVAQRDLENLRIESDETIHLWTERVDELETTVQNLQAENEATQADAEETIGVWESQCVELQLKVTSCEERESKLEAELQELRGQDLDGPTLSGHVSSSELEVERETRKAAEDRISSLQKKLEETEEKFSSFRETALSEQAKAQNSDDAQRLLERERVEGLEHEFDELRGSKAALEEERDGLKLLVSELEHELNEANDALQFHVTNEVSEQATRIAAEALRHQIDEMRAQADVDQTDLQAEQSARLAAEKEVTQLRGDLAALLGMEDNEENLSEIQRRTIEATEHFQRKERAEIEELKNALSRAVEELEEARAAVHECEERAGKADLQTSMVEQELVTAKSDLHFLSRTIEEMRDAESSRRVSLENRIASLETDHGVLRKFHSAEVENIRNELNQVTMEKDRLAQCLKESEKSREALMQASSRGQNQDGEVSLEMEVRLLRMEQAQLLVAVEEEAARGERRLREARAAEKSSKEADVFVEKELRLAAERTLKNANKELEELRAEVGRNVANQATSNSNALGDLTNTVNELRGRVHLLSDENTDLKDQLEATKNEAETTIQRLNEECRNARARASQLEREGRYEAEIRAEVARLQASETSKENPALSSRDDDSVNGLSHYNEQAQQDTTETVARLYDMIEEQKQAVIEERQLHAETNKDFEDCLAMLAQRALILNSLRDALTQAAGEDAVDTAIRRAEEQAVAEHGNFVRENE